MPKRSKEQYGGKVRELYPIRFQGKNYKATVTTPNNMSINNYGDINAENNATLSVLEQSYNAIDKARQTKTAANWRDAMNLTEETIGLVRSKIKRISPSNTESLSKYNKELKALQNQVETIKKEASNKVVTTKNNNDTEPIMTPNPLYKKTIKAKLGGYRRTHKRRHHKRKHTRRHR